MSAVPDLLLINQGFKHQKRLIALGFGYEIRRTCADQCAEHLMSPSKSLGLVWGIVVQAPVAPEAHGTRIRLL